MYTDIGWRNHLSVQRQGWKVVEKLNANGQAQLATSYGDCLNAMETLFKAANIVANR
jgi:predicted RNA-binding protein Jag